MVEVSFSYIYGFIHQAHRRKYHLLSIYGSHLDVRVVTRTEVNLGIELSFFCTDDCPPGVYKELSYNINYYEYSALENCYS